MKNYKTFFLLFFFSLSFLFSFSVLTVDAKGVGNGSGGVGGSTTGGDGKGGFGSDSSSTSQTGTKGVKGVGNTKGVVSHADGNEGAASGSASSGTASVDLKVNGRDSLTIEGPATFTLSWTAHESLRECKANGSSAGGWSTSGLYSFLRNGSRVLSNVPAGNYSYSIDCRGGTALASPENIFAFFTPEIAYAEPAHGGREGGAGAGAGGGTRITGSDTVTVTVTSGEEIIGEGFDGGDPGGFVPEGGAGSIEAIPSIVSNGGPTTVTWEGTDESCYVTGSNGDGPWLGQSGVETSSAIAEQTTFTLHCSDDTTRTSIVVNVNPRFEEF